ncbi:active breakpoint cluster region-related protein isoform X2 [Sitodiplosis mosellana]|uniref:active breakpoint cluster region-related protein isoform X2 n=1 Tax=Sitodiplosis mosellana TaxID=263140 RepID=UPI002443861C|nr:active breakpoint cluster region-related protein isoform X2 [Sitodiplosis mosellana]
MSVFSDFRRMWLKRFPDNSLSSEWEADVRVSLQRHKQKVDDLSKELEQEMLYVEYLERLLGDVEEFRKAGGDLSIPLEPSDEDEKQNASSVAAAAVATITVDQSIDKQTEKSDDIGSATNDEHTSVSINGNGSVSDNLQTIDTESSEFANSMAAIRSKVEKLNQSREQGTLHHHQCIDELTSHLRNTQLKNVDDSKIASPTRSETPTSFVTVIEVKDPSPIPTSIATSPTSTSISIAANDNVDSKPEPTTPAPTLPQQQRPQQQQQQQQQQEEPKDETQSTVIEKNDENNASPVQTVEIRRKIPPRPPPKVARRIGPVPDTPTTITETPPSPSTTTFGHPQSPSNNQSTCSSDSNVKPSEFLRHKHNDEKLSSVLLKYTQHGSITKSGQNSSSESLINSTNNEETLHVVESYPISERIKSYESISSLSSDGLKAVVPNANNTSANNSHSTIEHNNSGGHIDTEPYYDTVPIEETDDEIEADESDLRTNSLPKVLDSQLSVESGQVGERVSNYINIDYFLSQNRKLRDSSNESDDDLDAGTSSPPPRSIIDDTKNVLPSRIKAVAHADNHRNVQIRNIVSSIITSETFYVECLTKMLHYMKAMAATLTTSRPVISRNELQTMFFKVEELHVVHSEFLTSLKNKIANESRDIHIGDAFEELAKHIHIYGAFLHNYGQAIDTVKKCGENNTQFKEIVSKIVLNSQNEQLLTLEDLLHKPVARLQKNALVLKDLINETPSTHADYKPLIQSQKHFDKLLSEFNVVQNKSSSEDKALRRLVKNSFIVELVDGHRKLRHLFLFNDVIACAKYKASGRDRFEFELKWFISLKDIFIPSDDFVLRSPSASTINNPLGIDAKENNPSNLLSLKTQASAVRDLILAEERDDKKHKLYSSRSIDKCRKKLHDIEAQLVLASPTLVFRLGNKTNNKISTFFLSSQFERNQWIDTIINLQESCNLPSAQQVSLLDLQAWIAACQTFVKTEMGSYLMRNSRDESLLIGDLHLTIIGVSGFDKPSDLFCCVEADSYGHYFHKATTKTPTNCVNPQWNENFLIELEGCQNMRFLLYEDTGNTRPMLKAEHVLRLSRNWLEDAPIAKSLKLSDAITLNIIITFANEELQSCRVPTTKPGPIFGVKFQQVLKREKRDIPFIITSCIREVERRGMLEVGIYRVSGSASDLARLKKAFETNNYEAEQQLKDVDVHSVTGIFKSYLRELPETLFTDVLYRRLIETFNKFSNINENELSHELQKIFVDVPPQSKATINYILDHLLRVHQQENENKMSLHNLAMVFGPTLLRSALNQPKQKDQLEMSTVDVMAQAGILYCFLQARKK